jgi:hypothetical protein
VSLALLGGVCDEEWVRICWVLAVRRGLEVE